MSKTVLVLETYGILRLLKQNWGPIFLSKIVLTPGQENRKLNRQQAFVCRAAAAGLQEVDGKNGPTNKGDPLH